MTCVGKVVFGRKDRRRIFGSFAGVKRGLFQGIFLGPYGYWQFKPPSQLDILEPSTGKSRVLWLLSLSPSLCCRMLPYVGVAVTV